MNVNFLGLQVKHGQGEDFVFSNEKDLSSKKVEDLRSVQANPDIQHLKKKYLTAQDLLDAGIMEIPMLWSPFFPSKGIVGLTGSSDCGKSMLLRQLAIEVALGSKEFLGFPLNTKHSKALYVSTEDDQDGISALLRKQVQDFKTKDMSNLFFLFDSEDLLTKVTELITEIKVDLVVIDAWSDTFSGNPNNWVDIRKNLSELKRIAIKNDCLIVILHHTVKNSEKHSPDKSKLNGSQAIEAKLRCLMELRNGEADDERYLFVLKANHMSRQEKSEGILLNLNESLQFSNSGKSITKSGLVSENLKNTFDKDFWLTEFQRIKKEKNISIENAVNELKDKFSDRKVPSKTWFVNQITNQTIRPNLKK